MTDLPERPGPIACPFPPCRANERPLIHRVDPKDATKIVTVYPIHNVKGPAGWFGRCPASLFIVPKLTVRAKQHLRESLESYERRLAEAYRLGTMQAAIERARQQLDPQLPPAQRKTGPATSDAIDLRTGEYLDPLPQQLLGRLPHRPADDYFPGRPGDAPEPGRGEESSDPVPPGVEGKPLGDEDK